MDEYNELLKNLNKLYHQIKRNLSLDICGGDKEKKCIANGAFHNVERRFIDMNKDQTDIALSIPKELLEQDAPDVNNFGYDTDSFLGFVQEIILVHLKDYLIIPGTLL